MSGPEVTVDVTLLLYAFRYALGRRTGAPSDVAATIRAHLDVLPDWMLAQIVRDIGRAIDAEQAGAPCDVDEWTRLARDITARRSAS